MVFSWLIQASKEDEDGWRDMAELKPIAVVGNIIEL
jgi:hypothetical protein